MSKRFFQKVLALTLITLCALFSLPVSAAESAVLDLGKVTAEPSLRVRADAGTSFAILTTLATNTPVSILAKKKGWLQVGFSQGSRTQTGWVSADYVECYHLPLRTPVCLVSNLSKKTVTVNFSKKALPLEVSSPSRIRPQEQFELLATRDGWFNLRSCANQKYVSVEEDGNLTCRAAVTSESTAFRPFFSAENDTVGFVARKNGKVLSAVQNKPSFPLQSRSDQFKSWEQFLIMQIAKEDPIDGKTDAPSTDPAPESPSANTAIVNTPDLNVRSGPATSYEVRAKLTAGTSVNLVVEQNGWYLVTAADIVGFVSGQYLTLPHEPLPPTPVPPQPDPDPAPLPLVGNHTFYCQTGNWGYSAEVGLSACYLTSYAMVLTDMGLTATPFDVYKANNSQVLAYHDVICKAYGITRSKIFLTNLTADQKKAEIISALSQNPQGVMVRRGDNGHSVVATEVVDGVVYFNDPAFVNGANLTVERSSLKNWDNLYFYEVLSKVG